MSTVPPILARLVHKDSDRCLREFPIPEDMTREKFEKWAEWLKAAAGPDYDVEISANRRSA